MVQKKPRGLVLLVLNAHHAPGLVGISLLLPVQYEFDLAKSLGKLGVLPLVEGFHHGRHQLFRCLVFLELVQEPGHGCLSFRVHVFLLCFACKHVGEGFSLSLPAGRISPRLLPSGKHNRSFFFECRLSIRDNSF